MFSWFQNRKLKQQQDNHATEILRLLSPLYTQMRDYFDRNNQVAYIFEHEEQVKQFFSALSYTNESDFEVQKFKSIRNQYFSNPKSFKGMLYNPTEKYASPKEIFGTYDPNNMPKNLKQEDIKNLSELEKQPIYRGFIALHELTRYISSLRHPRNTDINPVLQEISLNQHLTDYLIKCQKIGKDKTLFASLLRREDEWLDTFFGPIHSLNRLLEIKSSVGDEVYIDPDERLDALMNWNTTQLHPVEKPKTAMDLIDEKLLNDDFYK